MPGRHGSGSLGGSDSGGGFRSSSGWSGGFRGGGWGYRPFGWFPFFGPRLDRGCGSLGVGLIVLLIILAVCGVLSRGFAPVQNNPGNNNPAPVNAGGGLANQPPNVQTQTAIDLRELHTAFDSRIPTWQNQIGDNQEQSIPPADAGLANDNNVKDVIYGKCGSLFYLYVIDKDVPDNANGADYSGYVYTTASSPTTCHPVEYTVTDSEDEGGHWYYVYVKSHSPG